MKMNNDTKLAILLVLVTILVFICVLGISIKGDATMPLEGYTRPVETVKRDAETSQLSNITEPEEPLESIVEEAEIEAAEEKIVYFDVPLSEDLQKHIFELCEESGIDPAIVISMIKAESNFDSSALGDSGRSKGLMQIQEQIHIERMANLGCTDLFDPYQNVTVGVDLLSELIGRGKGVEWALMAYNGGPKHANDNVKAGTVSKYVVKVMDNSNNLETK